MTVKELIEKLNKFPPNMDVVIRQCSEYQTISDEYPCEIKLYHNRGYYSRVYRPKDKVFERTVVEIAQGN